MEAPNVKPSETGTKRPAADSEFVAYEETPHAASRANGLRQRLGRFQAWLAGLIGERPSMPLSMAAVALAILVLPVAAGVLVRGLVLGAHRSLDETLTLADGSPDPVTALLWSPDGRLHVGTLSGRLLSFEAGGAVVYDARADGPVVGIEMPTGAAGQLLGSAPLAAALADGQLLPDLPSGPLATGLTQGPEECLSGYVWRQASDTDLTCVPPGSRDRAMTETANAVPEGEGADLTQPPECGDGLVPRYAFEGDRVCVTPESRGLIQEENLADQARKVLPDAARESTRYVDFTTIPAERALVALADNMVIAGTRIESSEQLYLNQQTQVGAGATAGNTTGLAQWMLTAQGTAMVGQVFGVEDVRAIERLPGTSAVVAGDGAGGVFLIDASQQISGVSPEQYVIRHGSHDAAITAIAASGTAPDTGGFATAAADGTVKVWWNAGTEPPTVIDIGTGGKWVVEFETPDRWVVGHAVSADGSSYLTADGDGVLTLTRLTDEDAGGTRWALPFELEGPAAFSSDGGMVAAFNAGSNALDLFSLPSPTLLQRLPLAMERPAAIEFSARGGVLAALSEAGELQLWRTGATGTGTGGLITFPEGPARSMTLNPDGSLIALGLEGGSVVILGTDGARLAELPQRVGSVSHVLVRFNATGKSLVIADPSTGWVTTYSLRRQRYDLSELDLPDARVLLISGDGRRVISWDATGALIISDIASGTTLGRIPAPEMPQALLASHDLEYVTAFAGVAADVYREQPSADSPGAPLTIAPDGLRLSAAGLTLLLRQPTGALHVADLRDLVEGRGDMRPIAPDLLATQAELSPDGGAVVIGTSTGTIVRIDLETNERTTIVGHGHVMQALAISTDGRYVASASLDGRVRVTDIERARWIGAVPLGTLSAVPPTAHLQARQLEARADLPVAVAVDPAEILVRVQLDGVSADEEYRIMTMLESTGWRYEVTEATASPGDNLVLYDAADLESETAAQMMIQDLQNIGFTAAPGAGADLAAGTLEVWLRGTPAAQAF